MNFEELVARATGVPLPISDEVRQTLSGLVATADREEENAGSDTRWKIAETLQRLLKQGWTQRSLAEALEVPGLSRSQMSIYVRCLDVRETYADLTFAGISALLLVPEEKREEVLRVSREGDVSIRTAVARVSMKVETVPTPEGLKPKTLLVKLTRALDSVEGIGLIAMPLTAEELVEDVRQSDSTLSLYVRDVELQISRLEAHLALVREWIADGYDDPPDDGEIDIRG